MALSWRTPARQRFSCLIWTGLLLGGAVAMVAGGPQEPLSFCLRLPLIVLAGGGTWCTARWRRRVTVTGDEVIVRTLLRTQRIPLSRAMCGTAVGTGPLTGLAQGGWAPGHQTRGHQTRGHRTRGGPARLPVPMVTPWLVLTATLGVALATAKVLTQHPQLTGAVLAAGAALCLATLGAWLRPDRSGGHRAGATLSSRGVPGGRPPG